MLDLSESFLIAYALQSILDCFVDTPSGGIAYWVIERGIKREDRLALEESLKEISAHAHWIFVATMRKPQDDLKEISLTTTERGLMSQTVFDSEIEGTELVRGKSLHYIDPGTAILHTHRLLISVHEPQIFSSKPISSSLSDVLIARKTGEFAHPGEREHLLKVKAGWEQLKAKKRMAAEKEAERQKIAQQAEAERLARLADQRAELQANLDAMVVMPRSVSKSSFRQPRSSQILAAYQPSEKIGTCLICGQVTSDWYMFDGSTGNCKCNDCLKSDRTASDKAR